ncbi:MAG: hypothetical protein K2L89_07445 [Muribaculaceae bacterium]|nr:hypothetical protein [Muribaculaceae bacterium]
MKLGFSYRVCSGGADSKVVTVNGGAWTNIIDDKRTIWTRYRINDTSMALTFVPDGMVVVVSHLVGGARPDDNVTTWIFVPSRVIISGAELLQVIRVVREINKMGTRNVTEATFINNPVLSKDYPVKAIAPAVRPSQGVKFAFRTPGPAASLEQILSLPYQSYYAPYKFIFLYETPGTGVQELTDFTGIPLEENVTVLPPSPAAVAQAFGPGQIVVRLDDGQMFNKPITRNKGERLSLQIEKQGCKPIDCFADVIADGAEVTLPVQRQGWTRIITSNNFIIRDAATGRNVPNVNVTIYGPDGRRTNNIPEENISKVNIQVSAPGYETVKKVENLSQGRVEIRMNRVAERKTFICNTRDGRKVQVTLDGVGATSANPIDGYSAQGDSLVYKGSGSAGGSKNSFAWKEFMMGAALIILIGLVCWGGSALINKFFGEKEVTEDVVEIEKTETEVTDEDANVEDQKQLKAALRYLENPAWHRDSMNNYPKLRDVWDHLNTFNVEELKKRTDLMASNNFANIIVAFEDTQRTKFPPKNNPDNEYVITVETYISKINRPDPQPESTITPAPSVQSAPKSEKSIMDQAKETKNRTKPKTNDTNAGKKNKKTETKKTETTPANSGGRGNNL